MYVWLLMQQTVLFMYWYYVNVAFNNNICTAIVFGTESISLLY